MLGVHALRSYLKLICEYEPHSLPNKKVGVAKGHHKNCIKLRPTLVRHLLRNRPLNRLSGALYTAVIHLLLLTLSLILLFIEIYIALYKA